MEGSARARINSSSSPPIVTPENKVLFTTSVSKRPILVGGRLRHCEAAINSRLYFAWCLVVQVCDLGSGGEVGPILLRDVDQVFLDGRELLGGEALRPRPHQPRVRGLVLAQRHLPVAPDDGVGLMAGITKFDIFQSRGVRPSSKLQGSAKGGPQIW